MIIWLDMANTRETILLGLFSMSAQKKSSAQIVSTSPAKLDWLIAIFGNKHFYVFLYIFSVKVSQIKKAFGSDLSVLR